MSGDQMGLKFICFDTSLFYNNNNLFLKGQNIVRKQKRVGPPDLKSLFGFFWSRQFAERLTSPNMYVQAAPQKTHKDMLVEKRTEVKSTNRNALNLKESYR